jgi:hypothetical protein
LFGLLGSAAAWFQPSPNHVKDTALASNTSPMLGVVTGGMVKVEVSTVPFCRKPGL